MLVTKVVCLGKIFFRNKQFSHQFLSPEFLLSQDSYHYNVHVTIFSPIFFCVTKYVYNIFLITTFTMCTVPISAEIRSDLVRGPSLTSGWSDHTACSHSYWNKTEWGSVGMFQVIKTGWPQHGQETISSNDLLFVSWISRAMDWGRHNWVWDKAPVSRLKLSKFNQDLNPHLNIIFRPGHGILSRYWNSHFTGTMVRHPHHDNTKLVGLGQCTMDWVPNKSKRRIQNEEDKILFDVKNPQFFTNDQL